MHLVEVVRDAPRRCRARLDSQIDEGFRTDGRANRPQVELRHGPIAGLPYARAGPAILDPDVVVFRAGAETFEVCLDRLSGLQFLQVHDRSAVHVGKTLESARRTRLERQLNRRVRTGWLA